MSGPAIRPAQSADIPRWLLLAREVEHLFGPMAGEESFRNALAGAVDEGAAFVVDSPAAPGEPLPGGIVIDRTANGIAWLAVASAARGNGYGGSLLTHALACLNGSAPVRVETFDPTTYEGMPARALYLRAGFRDTDETGVTPAGVPTVVMIRAPR